jgi:hypothetical protein
MELCYTHTKEATRKPPNICLLHTGRRTQVQLCSDNTVYYDYSSPGSIGSTSTVSCAATTWPHRFYCTYVVHPDASSRHSTFRQSVALALTVRPVTTSRSATIRRPDCTGSTTHMLCIRTRRLDARLLVGRSHWLSPCARSLHLAVHRLYCAYAVHPNVPSRHSTSRRSVALALAVCPVIPLCAVTTCLAAATDILCLRRATVCLGTSRGSSSTTSPTPCVRVPRHLTWLVKWLVTWLVVDYFTSRRLVVDNFAYAARPGASARRAARLAACHQLLRLRCASGCLDTSRNSSRGSSSTTPCVATSSCGHTCSTLATSCIATTCLSATLALLRVHRTPP